MNEQELQIELSKMLPDKIYLSGVTAQVPRWEGRGCMVEITEWLHVCWLVEQGLSLEEHDRFRHILYKNNQIDRAYTSSSWQQRAEALCKVKGVTP